MVHLDKKKYSYISKLFLQCRHNSAIFLPIRLLRLIQVTSKLTMLLNRSENYRDQGLRKYNEFLVISSFSYLSIRIFVIRKKNIISIHLPLETII